MSNNIFPMPEQPQHFSDYGFDPQIDYFQFLEEARKHKREATTRTSHSIDTIHFKLQKPISKDEIYTKSKHNNKRRKWWKTALMFFKLKWIHTNDNNNHYNQHKEDVHIARARAFRASISGPVYVSGSGTECGIMNRPSSGPLDGGFSPAWKSPYLSLRQLSMEQQQQRQRMSTSSMPVYLIT